MTWEELEKMSGIKFKKEDGSFRPVDEWLDDLYIKKLPIEIDLLMAEIMDHDELFSKILKHQK